MDLNDEQKISLMREDPSYTQFWGHLLSPQERATLLEPLGPSQDKPRASIQDLANARQRCRESLSRGLPCREFSGRKIVVGGVANGGASAHTSVATWAAAQVPEQAVMRVSSNMWVVGVTTVPQRRGTLLPRTLESLKAAGFEVHALFVDGAGHNDCLSYEAEFKIPTVGRYPTMRTFGNWILGLAELFIRNPTADRFAMFQDDLVCSIGLREYLDATGYPDGKASSPFPGHVFSGMPRGYLNLYTFDYYARKLPRDHTQARNVCDGWHVSPTQQGLGAVGLVFNRDCVWDLLAEREHIVTRPSVVGVKAYAAIDGGICAGLNKKGWREYVHHPSLIQHTGVKSVMGNNRHADARTFKGEDFDLRTLLRKR